MKDGRLCLDLLDRIKLAMPGPGTDFFDALPRFWRFDIRIPERPRAALRGANRIDRAPALFGMQEGAIAAAGEFLEADPIADPPCVLRANFFQRLSQELGDLDELFFVDPDVTFRSRAAIAALRTLEPQAVFVPFFVAHAGYCKLPRHALQRAGQLP